MTALVNADAISAPGPPPGGALCAHLSVRFAPARDGNTAARVSSTSGLELRGPFAALEGGLTRYFLRNVTAGMLDGDAYEVRCYVASGARLAISPTAAGRVFVARDGMRGGARVTTRIEVEPGGVLDFDAGLTIPHAGAVGTQTTEVILHPGARVALSDILAFGRLARGERFAFRRLTSELSIRTPEGALLYERRSVVEPGRDRDSLGAVVGEAGVLASMTLLGEGPRPVLADVEGVYAGVSTLPPQEGGIVGYGALALAARPEQAARVMAGLRARWLEAPLDAANDAGGEAETEGDVR